MVEKPASTIAPGSDGWHPSKLSPVAHLWMLLAASLAMFYCRVAQEGNIGLLLVVAGAGLVIFPPKITVDWKIWMFATALLLLSASALLPHGWFSDPEWRRSLLAAGVPLPDSISPHPRETWFWLGILAVAVSVGLFGLAHPMRSRAQLYPAVAAVAICATYAGLAIYARQSGREFPFAPDPDSFGIFPNRNHMATFMVTGSVLSLGILRVAFLYRHWVAGAVAAVSLVECVRALVFFSPSRGGIFFLLAGALLWLAGLGRVHRSKPLLISFAAVFLGGILLLLGSGSVARHRVLLLVGWEKDRAAATQPINPATAEVPQAPLDGRIPIFQDTLRLIRDYPFTGCGLGAFRYVFPFYRERTGWDVPVIHPESDWLMLASEAGVPALATLMAGMGWLIRRVWSLRKHPYWPLRWAILCAAFAALLHGFVDVPAHRASLGWWILAIAGVGFQMAPREPARPSRVQHLLFVIAGFGAFALGIPMIRAEWFAGRSSPPLAAYAEQAEIIGLRVDGKLPEAVAAARTAIAVSPLVDVLYYQLGVTLLRLDGKSVEADTVLRAQRLINPLSPRVPIDQGGLWLDIDPEKSAQLWTEAVRRAERIDRYEPARSGSALPLYRDLLARAAAIPVVQRSLLGAYSNRPDFVLAWLDQSEPGLVASELPRLAADATFRDALTEPDRRRFLEAWYRKGDREQLFQWVAGRPEWQRAAWPITLRRIVDAGQFAEAVQAAATRFGFSLALPEPGSGESDIPPSADESRAASFDRFWRKGNVVTARRILDEARAENPPTEPEIWRLSAAICARDGQWQAAWQHLERYLRESRLDSVP